MRHGYKVKRSLPELTAGEQKRKDEEAIRHIAEAMRRRKKKD
jgi:hypothetical protein